MPLILFGAVAGVASVIVVGQVLARQVAADAAENPTLAALGLDRRQLLLVAFARPVVIALAGAAVAVATAVAFSPIFPLGLARRAEIHPGVSVNVAVLAVGFVAVVVVVLLRALLQAWAEARTGSVRHADQAHARPARFTDAMANSGLGPAATVGAAMSFERGRGIAFRATVVGVAVAVAGVVAAVTFGVSLHHLVDTPSQQGWSWDVFVGNPNSQGDPGDPDSIRRKLASKLAANPNVGGYSGFALVESITLDGRQVNIAGVDAVKGSVFPPIIEGRPPSAPDEIVLGRDPLRQLHRRVGQTVIARSGDNSATMRIVGVWMQPTASDLSDKLSGGGGATLAGVRALVPAAPVYQFAVRYRTGVDRQAAFRSIRNDIGREVLRPYPAGDVSNLAQVDFLPYVLAAFLVTLALGALGLSLLTSVRRHRRDLAVLKAIGFAPHQVAATVAWQAAILVVVALVVGMPAGVALGRWTWHLVADNIGSVSPPVVPIAVLLVVPATLLIASLLAAGMGWAASRVRPATTLRTE